MTPALYAACANAVHVVKTDGMVLRGGRATLFLLAELGYGPVNRVLALPPFVWAVEAGYGVVANHRDFFAGFLFTRDRSAQAPEPPPEANSPDASQSSTPIS